MVTKKGGTILVNLETKKIALIYRRDTGNVEFPKGHWEEGETIQECAIRETEEETGRKNHLKDKKEIDIIKYITSKGENVELYMYIAIDDGPTENNIEEEDKEKWDWFDINEVDKNITFENLKEFWKNAKIKVQEVLNNI